MKNIVRAITGVFIISTAVIACQKSASLNNSTLNQPHQAKIFLTDHQTPLFDSVFIDIQSLEVKVDGDSLGNEGWVTLDIRPGIYNILRFRNGLDTLFGNGTLPNANIRKIRLTLGTQNSVMLNNQSFPLNIHGNDGQVVIDLDESNFDVVGSDQVLFWIDFDAAGSIRVDNSGQGNNNGFELKPHLKVFTKTKSGRIEGEVFPKAADALVMAINGTDTTMAIPDDDNGEFKIVGLDTGTYSVFIDAQNGYIDTTINNVQVMKGEDTHLPSITLHQ
ncbi:MAG: DUF4382 domain-containing protein [Chitinophagales bacterium]